MNLCQHGIMDGIDCYWCNSKSESYWSMKFCDMHGMFRGDYCTQCTFVIKEFIAKTNTDKEMKTRKYLPTVSDLIDRLTIVQQKELKIPEHRDEYTQELNDLMHDIAACFSEQYTNQMTAEQMSEMVRDIVVLTLMNCEIWHNESNFRKGIKDGNDLELTHGLNGIRNTAKNKLQEKFGGRKDYKLDNVKAFKEWIPSGYGEEKPTSEEDEYLCENCGLEAHPNMPCEYVGGIDKRKAK